VLGILLCPFSDDCGAVPGFSVDVPVFPEGLLVVSGLLNVEPDLRTGRAISAGSDAVSWLSAELLGAATAGAVSADVSGALCAGAAISVFTAEALELSTASDFFAADFEDAEFDDDFLLELPMLYIFDGATEIVDDAPPGGGGGAASRSGLAAGRAAKGELMPDRLFSPLQPATPIQHNETIKALNSFMLWFTLS
jgi:hypothetical protein